MTPGRVIRAPLPGRRVARTEAKAPPAGSGKVTDDLPGVTFLMFRSFRNVSPEHAGSPRRDRDSCLIHIKPTSPESRYNSGVTVVLSTAA